MVPFSLMQERILHFLEKNRGQWYSACEIGEEIGNSSARSVGCSLRGLFHNGLIERRGISRNQSRLKTEYRIKGHQMESKVAR